MNFRLSFSKFSACLRWSLATLLAAVLSFTLAPARPALAACDPTASIARISVSSDGTQGNGDSIYLDISGDGRFVAFWSQATNLTNPAGGNIFVYDRETCQTIVTGNTGASSSFPTISAEGRFEAFSSVDNNLVSGDTGEEDVFVSDLQTSQISLVSVSSSGEKGNSFSWLPFISSNGNYIVFTSYATNLTANCLNGKAHIYVRDRQANQTTCVSVDSSGIQGNGDSNRGSISADGRYVAFYSAASNLAAGDIDDAPYYKNDVFIHDRQTGQTTSISVDSFNEQVGDHSGIELEISADGRYVVFVSTSSNLVLDDTNNTDDVFVRDLQTGQTNRVSVDSNGTQGNGASSGASISADGRYISFVSSAGNLIPDDTNTCGQFYLTPGTCPDFFVHDRVTGETIRTSLSASGTQTSEQLNYQIFSQAISGDGSYVAFSTDVSDLVPGDTNNKKDIVLVRLFDPVPPPTTLIITSANDQDDGVCNAAHCSLREAISAANQLPDTNTIAFAISGSGVQTIQPNSELPASMNPVIIDGTTQPGFAGTPLIELDGTNAGASARGLTILGGNTTVKGLIINRFAISGIWLTIGGGNVVVGNYIGTDSTGTQARGNLNGVSIAESPNNTIGGLTPADRNIISANIDDGIELYYSPTTDTVIQGNYIGTDVTGTLPLGNGESGIEFQQVPNAAVGGTTPAARNIISGNQFGIFFMDTSTQVLIEGNYIGTNAAGTAALPNQVGIWTLNGTNTQIGGATAAERNVISGNVTGIKLSGISNRVQGNYIGVAPDGVTPLGNSGAGIEMDTFYIGIPPSNTIGGLVVGTGNLIAHNGSYGITSNASALSVKPFAMLGNSIFSNGNLGIDLAGDGMTPNDPGDADTGPNGLQNFPVLSSGGPFGGGTTINGTLNSQPNQTYRLEFFANVACDPSGNGEGQTYLGFANVTTNGSGDVSFTANLTPVVSPGQFITATATDLDNNTSEFSACVPVVVISPPAAAPVRNYFTTPSVPLSWDGVSWAVGYEIEVDTDTNFADPYVYTNRSLGASAQSDTATLPSEDRVYYWRVGAKKAGGGIVWSVPQTFTVDVP